MIHNKLESDRLIISSGVNYTPFHLVSNEGEAFNALTDIRHRKMEPVSIRFKGNGMQPFKPNLSCLEAMAFVEDHFKYDKTPLGIYEATEHYDQHRQWNGEIQLHSNGTLDAHWNPSSTLKMRDALKAPGARHIVKASWDYKPLRWAVDYLCRFGFIGPVVELTRFAVPVGVKPDFVVIWEVRDF